MDTLRGSYFKQDTPLKWSIGFVILFTFGRGGVTVVCTKMKRAENINLIFRDIS